MEHIFGSISTQLVSSAALTLIHFIWQAVTIALVLKLSLVIIPQKYLLTRYRLAVLALAVTVALPCFTFYTLLQSPDIVQSTMDYSSKAIGLFEEMSEAQSTTTQSGNVESSEQINGVSVNSNLVENRNSLLLNLLIIWVIGCLFMLAKFVFDLNATYRLAKEGVVPVNRQIDDIVSRLAYRYKISRPIQILKSSVVNVPIVVGWLRPVILLPIAISVGLDKAQLELIIAHELAHIKRMDFAVNILQNLVQIVFFYHPAVHWINQIIREEREYICDSMALNIVGNNTDAKLNLAKALLNTEELREGNFSLIAVAASGGKLKNRISHILESEYRPATSIKALLLSVFAFMFSLAAMASTIAFDNSTGNLQAENSLLVQVELNSQREMKLADKRVEEESSNEILIDTTGPQNSGVEFVAVKTKKNDDDFNQVSQTKQKDIRLSRESKSVRNSLLSANVDDPTKIKTLPNKERHFEKNALQKAETDKQAKLSSKSTDAGREKQANRLNLIENMIAKDQPTIPNPISSKTLKQSANNESYKIASLDLSSVKDYTEPRALYTPYPRYPKQSWRKMTNQIVPVNFVINSDGKIEDIKIRGKVDRAFVREVKHKLRRWRYQPAVENGEKVKHVASLEFVFKAPQEKTIIPITTGTRIR